MAIGVLLSFQTGDTAINVDHEEWVLDPDKTLAESDISKRNTT